MNNLLEESGLLGKALHVDKFLVEPLLGQQLVVCAALNYMSFFEHHDEVGMAYGGEPVGYHYACASLHQSVEALLHRLLRSLC